MISFETSALAWPFILVTLAVETVFLVHLMSDRASAARRADARLLTQREAALLKI